MKKVFAICGKICSGKTYYANQLKEKENAVILSCDELTKVLFDNNLGEKHDEITKRIRDYFLKKTVDIVNANANVILDWGFWSKKNRDFVSDFFKSRKIIIEWHYIDIDNESWEKNIEERNKKVLSGEDESNYYLDEGLMNKLLSKWEDPKKDDIDVWYKFKR